MCNQRNKKTINAEHVLEALDRLGTNFFFNISQEKSLRIFPKSGFKDYKKEAEAVLSDCKQVAAKRRRKNTRLENLGIPEEELFRQQQELFAKAREHVQQEEQAAWCQLQAAAVQQSAQLLHNRIHSQEESDDDY